MSARRRFALLLALATAAAALAACGSEERQDANEPEGEFEVEVTTAAFSTEQRLAETHDLVLGIENTGAEAVPELSLTVFVGDGTADGSFKVRSDQPGLANPNRPIWVLQNKYPRFVGQPPPKGLAGGFRAETNTFGFGPLEPGQTKDLIWRVTPVQSGIYTLSFIVEAGLAGKAQAVTADGDEVRGEFVVEIKDEPARQRVNGQGKVVTKN